MTLFLAIIIVLLVAAVVGAVAVTKAFLWLVLALAIVGLISIFARR